TPTVNPTVREAGAVRPRLKMRDLFDYGFSLAKISVRPTPFLMQPQPAALEHLRTRMADTGAERGVAVDVVIAHVERSRCIRHGDQAAEPNRTAFIRRPHTRSVLAIVKMSLGVARSVRSAGAYDESPIVVGDRRISGLGSRSFRCR